MTLVLGGGRNGKSTYAQTMVESSRQLALFVATAIAGNDEIAARIAAHRASRPAHWLTLEAPLQVGDAIRMGDVTPWVLVDCITLLTSNILLSCPEPIQESNFRGKLKQEIGHLTTGYHDHPGNWVIVSNEVELGLVPLYPLGRYYRDRLGWANQKLAQISDRVIFMIADFPMIVK